MIRRKVVLCNVLTMYQLSSPPTIFPALVYDELNKT